MQFQQSTSRDVFWTDGGAEVSHQSLDHLLAMAHQYHREGSVWQAMEMYWMLSEDHSGTAQSLDAQKSLFELAETYERDDSRHLARAVYERLSYSV
jgi:hypothetical protein